MLIINVGDILFGYLQIHKPELLVKDFYAYKGVYCGLCKQLGKSYGYISRLTLSYDCTLLALVYVSLNDNNICFSKGRCVVNPLKKCQFCTENESLKFSSAVSAILTYYKLQDDISDSGFFGKVKNRFICLFFKKGYKKARKDYPNIEKAVANMMKEQWDIEHSDNASVDLSADPTAKFISNLILSIPNPHNIPVKLLERFGYFLGRWIYLIDAADDYDKDLKKQNFNPFVNYFKDKDCTRDEVTEYCNSVLNLTVSQMMLAYNLIDFSHFKRVLDNIMNYGLSEMQRKCLFDKHNK